MKNNLLPVILTATAFGLLAGAAGSLLTNVYSSGNLGGFDFNRELNLSNYGYLSPNLVIRDAKKVVVNQDVKADETIRDLRGSLLGVFTKMASGTVYEIKSPFAQALAATSDGWVMVSWPKTPVKAEIDKMKETYVVIDSAHKIYTIDQVLASPETTGGFIFFHLKDANGLNVRRLVPDTEIKTGQSVILAAKGDSFKLDTLSAKIAPANLSSDVYPMTIELAGNMDLRPAFIFNLSGEIIGAVDAEGEMIVSPELDAYWRSLVKSRKLSLPVFGVNYLDLANVTGDKTLPEKGALLQSTKEDLAVIKNSAADRAGLKEGDIIVRINGTEINAENNLSVLIAAYNPGDKINVSYLRAGVSAQTEVTLGQSE